MGLPQLAEQERREYHPRPQAQGPSTIVARRFAGGGEKMNRAIIRDRQQARAKSAEWDPRAHAGRDREN